MMPPGRFPKLSTRVIRCISLLFFLLHGGYSIAASYNLKMDVGGQERLAKVVESSADPQGPAPLVLAFHGYDDSPRNFSRFADLHRSWPEAIIVYPQGLQVPDSEGTLRAKGWQTSKGLLGDRDLLYVDALLVELASRYQLDERRIYATGMSNGARLVFLLMSERPHVFAAFAPVATSATRQVAENLAIPKPVLYIIGRGEPQWRLEDARLTVEAISRVNRSGREQTQWAENYVLFKPAQGGADFVFNLHQAGHVWPYGGSDRIMHFFRQYRLE